MVILAYATVGVLLVDIYQNLVDWVWRKWGQQVTPYQLMEQRWFTFGTLDTGDLRSKRYWHFFTLALPVYGYHHDICNDDYRWSRLRIAWWKGQFRHRWDEVRT